MKRVAIDFGTTGIRVAETQSPDGHITFRRFDGPASHAALEAALTPYAGRIGVEVTLRCTHPDDRDRSAEFWNDFATNADCRWFRVLDDERGEGVTLGIARQVAVERRLDRLAVIDVGASQASISIVAARGKALGRDSWRIAGHDVGRIAADAVECMATTFDVHPEKPNREPLPIFGIGGAGPDAAKAIVERFDTAMLIEDEHAAVLPTVGILHADIIRSFSRPLPVQPDTQQLRGCFLQLMDDAYDAITREGYDMDDAECERLVFMQTADGEHKYGGACAMTADPEQLANEFRNVAGLPDLAPIHFISAAVGARIEPVKPALIGNIVMASR